MKSAAVISIGNELLTGTKVDTNASYLCRELLSCGVATGSILTIGDDVQAIVDAFKMATDAADIVLVTGGLGPTGDDLTRQSLADFLGVKLEFHQELFDQISAFFARIGREMSNTNRVQAFLPAGAQALVNSIGTAPGIAVQTRGKFIACMPGVPVEMKNMFAEHLAARLKEIAHGQGVVTRKLMCYGTGESAIAAILGDRMERGRNPLVNTTASAGVVTVHVVASAPERAAAERMAQCRQDELRDLLGDIVYGQDDQTLAEVVGRVLTQCGKTLCVAESCTGGLLGKMITDMPGATAFFKCGWITYSNEAKVRDLNVDAAWIEEHGAVSEPVAAAMAQGARSRAAADYALAITGIAGPAGGTEQKPVGLVYIALDAPKGTTCRRFLLSSSRQDIRLRSALAALDMLRRDL